MMACKKELSKTTPSTPIIGQQPVVVVPKDTVKLKLDVGVNIVGINGDLATESRGQFAVVTYDYHTLPVDVTVKVMWDETDENKKLVKADLSITHVLTVARQTVVSYTGISTVKTHNWNNVRIAEVKAADTTVTKYFFKW